MPNITIHRTSGKLCLPSSGDFQRWAESRTRFGSIRPLVGESCTMLELETIGPFSWLSSCDDAPPRVFDSPASNKCGVYLFTVPTEEGYLIYWVGQTSQPVRTRLATHSREFLAGTYNILDMAELREGKRTVLWRGLWWRKDAADRYEEYLLSASKVALLTLTQLRATRIYMIPTPKDRRFLARLEASIVNTLYADSKVGTILDRGYNLAPRWDTEDPIQIRLTGPNFRGLPSILNA